MTDPSNFAFQFDGLFVGAQVDVTQPLYTFGKIAHARNAARAGLDAQRALADEAAGDLAVDAARAYWGVKLARELGVMLDDGIDEIDEALEEDFADQAGRSRSRIASASRCCSPRPRSSAPRRRGARAAGARRPACADRRCARSTSTTRSSPRSSARCRPARGRAITARRRVAARAGAKAADELAAFDAS